MLVDAFKAGHSPGAYIPVWLREEKYLFSLQTHLFIGQMPLYEGDLQLRCSHMSKLAQGLYRRFQLQTGKCSRAPGHK